MNQIKTLDFNGEKMAFFTFVDPNNRNMEVTEWHHRVHSKLNIPINYFQIDYRLINHGGAMEKSIALFKEQVDYFCFIDNDCLLLRKEVPQEIYEKIKDKKTIFGGCQNSNHIHVNPTHPFVQPSSFCISTKLYQELGNPHLADFIKRSDTCEEVTWLCQERGYNICMVYPSHYNELTDEEIATSGNPKKWRLTETLYYGLGTTYGDVFFHAGMQSLPRSKDVFIAKCKEVLSKNEIDAKLEAVIVCVKYSKFLEITLQENIKHFDNIIVVTTEDDLATQNVINKYQEKVSYVTTNRFYESNAVFDKGSAINEGLLKLKYNSFVCHLDCDIVLPEDFRQKLNLKDLNIDTLYGCPRFFINNYQDWLEYKNNKKAKEDFSGLELGGWGCGYIQIWNMRSYKIRNIPVKYLYPSYPTAAESDILMLKRFHPDVVSVGKLDIQVAHLGNCGVNHDTKDNKNFFN